MMKWKRLIASGVDVGETNQSGCTALIWSIVFSRDGITKRLIDSGADIEQPDTKGMTPLMFAALAKNQIIFERLLNAGADIHAAQTGGENEIGKTVLYHAVSRKSNFLIVKELVDRGAVVTVATETGRTVLMRAAYRGDVEYIDLLVEKGADLERVSNSGQTTLHSIISISDKLEMFNYLMDRGVNVNTADKRGRTPLMEAAFWGQPQYVKRLVEAGAETEAKSNEGETALEMARKRKRTEVISYLESLN